MTIISNLRNKTLVGCFALLLALPSVSSAAGQPAEKDVMKNVASYLQWNTPVTVKLNGNQVADQAVMINTQILLPLRPLFESAGASVAWDDSNGSVLVKGTGYSFTVRPGESSVTLNGTTTTLDHAAVIEDGRLLVPARLAALALDAGLNWDSANRILNLATSSPAAAFKVESTAYAPYGDIPLTYAQTAIGGKNISMPIRWSGAPEGTKSFAIVMYDSHPIADNYIHWSVIDLPASSQGLDEGTAGHLQNGKEAVAYYGMLPPQYSGDHPYRIAVYALDTDHIEVPGKPVFFEDLEPALKQHTLARAELEGFFKQ